MISPSFHSEVLNLALINCSRCNIRSQEEIFCRYEKPQNVDVMTVEHVKDNLRYIFCGRRNSFISFFLTVLCRPPIPIDAGLFQVKVPHG